MAIAGVKNHLWLHLVILMSILAISRSVGTLDLVYSTNDTLNCVYTFYVKTGSVFFAGTDSNITVSFFDSSGKGIIIYNIVTWGGRMGPGHDYFEIGNLDIFSGRSLCLAGPVCSLRLTSDGSGSLPRWYVNYLEVVTSGAQKACGKQLFTLNTWLSPPFSKTVNKNNCRNALATEEDVSDGLTSIVVHDSN